jgi:hypothetical protein
MASMLGLAQPQIEILPLSLFRSKCSVSKFDRTNFLHTVMQTAKDIIIIKVGIFTLMFGKLGHCQLIITLWTEISKHNFHLTGSKWEKGFAKVPTQAHTQEIGLF